MPTIAQVLPIAAAAALSAHLAAASEPSLIRDDEKVLILPTAARLDPAGDSWTIHLHAWVLEPEEGSFTRRMTVAGLADLLDLPAGSAANQQFRARAQAFLVDNQPDKTLELRLDGRHALRLPPTGANGRVQAEAHLPAADLPPSDGNPWVSAEIVLQKGDIRSFAGEVQLIAAEGTSVVSDIDDTIKISHVTDTRRLLEHTFLKRYEPVPGMAEVYRSWQKAGAVFHYVSSSPWQLYPALAEFMTGAGLPRGSFHLRSFRVKDESFFNLFTSAQVSKPPIINALLAHHPRRDFILVGDSGEQDPEIYGAIARAHPGRIRHIHIRLATPERRDDARMQAAFAGLPADLWSLFEEPGQLPMAIGGG